MGLRPGGGAVAGKVVALGGVAARRGVVAGKVVALGEVAARRGAVAGKAGFRAHHLTRHFGLSSALVAIPAGKEVLLVSHLAHSPAPPCPLVATSLPNQEHRRAR